MAVNLVDAALTFIVLVAVLTLSPVFGAFTSMARAEADPFSAVLLGLVVPLLVLGVIVSLGVSARRGG